MHQKQLDDYAEAVLRLVESVPLGQVTSYGRIAERVGQQLGRGGPRQVAAILRQYGGTVPWYRCIKSDRTLAIEIAVRQAEQLAAEGVPVHHGRVPAGYFYNFP